MPQTPSHLFPLVLTTKLQETRDFYANKAGFRVVFDRDMYLQVASIDPAGPELCFMRPDGFPDGKARPAFQGDGLIISVPTPNADRKYAELEAKGVAMLSPVSDKPWGWRSFMTQDPNGVVLDFFHVYQDHPPM